MVSEQIHVPCVFSVSHTDANAYAYCDADADCNADSYRNTYFLSGGISDRCSDKRPKPGNRDVYNLGHDQRRRPSDRCLQHERRRHFK